MIAILALDCETHNIVMKFTIRHTTYNNNHKRLLTNRLLTKVNDRINIRTITTLNLCSLNTII
jgi:hypothetical protein